MFRAPLRHLTLYTTLLMLLALPAVSYAGDSAAPASSPLLASQIDPTQSYLDVQVDGKYLQVNFQVTFIAPGLFASCELAYAVSFPRPNHYVAVLTRTAAPDLHNATPASPQVCKLSLRLTLAKVEYWVRHGKPVLLNALASLGGPHFDLVERFDFSRIFLGFAHTLYGLGPAPATPNRRP